MISLRLVSIAAAALALTACAPQSKYAWGNYDSALYNYYQSPAKQDDLIQELRKTITQADASGLRVAPGLYAEYGHLLLQTGQNKEAIVYFEKERQAWPESATLMNTMIEVASSSSGNTRAN